MGYVQKDGDLKPIKTFTAIVAVQDDQDPVEDGQENRRAEGRQPPGAVAVRECRGGVRAQPAALRRALRDLRRPRPHRRHGLQQTEDAWQGHGRCSCRTVTPPWHVPASFKWIESSFQIFYPHLI